MVSNTYLSADATRELIEESNRALEQRRATRTRCSAHTALCETLPRSFIESLMCSDNEDELANASFWLRDADFMPNGPHFAVQLLRAVVCHKRDTAEAIAGAWAKAADKQRKQASDAACESAQ